MLSCLGSGLRTSIFACGLGLLFGSLVACSASPPPQNASSASQKKGLEAGLDPSEEPEGEGEEESDSAEAKGPGEEPPAASTQTPKKKAKQALPAPENHRQALMRQLELEPGRREDKDRQLRVFLPDAQNWARIRLSQLEPFVAFRYGEDRHAYAVVFTEASSGPPEVRACAAKFERDVLGRFEDEGGELGPISEQQVQWRDQASLLRSAQGHIRVLFSGYDFSASWLTVPAFPNGCLVYGIILQHDGEEALARKVLERYQKELLLKLKPMTKKLPHRRSTR